MNNDVAERYRLAVNGTIFRSGIDDLMDWLETETDFFTSPASTRFHGSYDGGLVEHSLNVFNQMLFEMDTLVGPKWEEFFSIESVAIIALFHDLCKIGRYEKVTKWRKDSDNQWESYEAYQYDDSKCEMGHGPQSIFYIQQFMQLTEMEAQAIFWHMGAYDISPYANLNGLSSAWNNNQLAFIISRADLACTYATENDKFVFAPAELHGEEYTAEVVEDDEPEELPKEDAVIRRREPKEETAAAAKPGRSSTISVPKKVDEEPQSQLAKKDMFYYLAEDEEYWMVGEGELIPLDEEYFKLSVEVTFDEYEKAVNAEAVVEDEPEAEEAFILEEDFFYQNTATGKYGKVAKGEELPVEYDEETWEPVTEAEYLKYLKPAAVVRGRKTPTPQNRPRR